MAAPSQATAPALSLCEKLTALTMTESKKSVQTKYQKLSDDCTAAANTARFCYVTPRFLVFDDTPKSIMSLGQNEQMWSLRDLRELVCKLRQEAKFEKISMIHIEQYKDKREFIEIEKVEELASTGSVTICLCIEWSPVKKE